MRWRNNLAKIVSIAALTIAGSIGGERIIEKAELNEWYYFHTTPFANQTYPAKAQYWDNNFPGEGSWDQYLIPGVLSLMFSLLIIPPVVDSIEDHFSK